MKIENMVTKEQLDKVVLQLTASEAAELRDSLDTLLRNRDTMRHEHVPSGDFKKEITVFLCENSTRSLG